MHACTPTDKKAFTEKIVVELSEHLTLDNSANLGANYLRIPAKSVHFVYAKLCKICPFCLGGVSGEGSCTCCDIRPVRPSLPSRVARWLLYKPNLNYLALFLSKKSHGSFNFFLALFEKCKV